MLYVEQASHRSGGAGADGELGRHSLLLHRKAGTARTAGAELLRSSNVAGGRPARPAYPPRSPLHSAKLRSGPDGPARLPHIRRGSPPYGAPRLTAVLSPACPSRPSLPRLARHTKKGPSLPGTAPSVAICPCDLATLSPSIAAWRILHGWPTRYPLAQASKAHARTPPPRPRSPPQPAK